MAARGSEPGGAGVVTEGLVLYDGVCALCDGTVRALLVLDRGARLRFAPLQGETAREVLARHPDADRSLSTILYARGAGTSEESVHQRSDAVLSMLYDIGGIAAFAAVLRIVPRPLRDAVYDLVARHRYRWFGKYDACRLPRPGERARFLP